MIAALLSIALVVAAPVPLEKPKENPLTPKEIAEGWVMLFDGQTTFGWDAKAGDLPDAKKPEVTVKAGNLRISGTGRGTVCCTTPFPEIEVELEFRLIEGEPGYRPLVGLHKFDTCGQTEAMSPEWTKWSATWSREGMFLPAGSKKPVLPGHGTVPSVLKITLGSLNNGTVELRSIRARPLGTKPLFNGKNLDGWKVTQTDPKRTATKFEVTPTGELSAKNGPGDLQTEKQFDDFVLQFECKTNGLALNSGLFFRCMPDAYQNGYEAQIQNAYLGDRTKPIDYGTGAIYRRVAARKVVSNDNEWFTMTIAARGAHIATWVNGYQTVDWTDDRKANDNPRQGLRTAKGHLSIQGHDPTTDLLFRNIRISELPN